MGWIDTAALRALAEPYLKTEYGRYLMRIAEGGVRRSARGTVPRPPENRWTPRPGRAYQETRRPGPL